MNGSRSPLPFEWSNVTSTSHRASELTEPEPELCWNVAFPLQPIHLYQIIFSWVSSLPRSAQQALRPSAVRVGAQLGKHRLRNVFDGYKAALWLFSPLSHQQQEFLGSRLQPLGLLGALPLSHCQRQH